eukprot:TRINITY_DN3715_c0_g1_i1.p1 TRINITY_DN3715_c0_g1~~TRINITY_DN3715_c0_g1_i1.p1  ORF type:complete len:335 (+),score=75.80 TRINITY_DN3715_c0_g1_i1:249-1253(+)
MDHSNNNNGPALVTLPWEYDKPPELPIVSNSNNTLASIRQSPSYASLLESHASSSEFVHSSSPSFDCYEDEFEEDYELDQLVAPLPPEIPPPAPRVRKSVSWNPVLSTVELIPKEGRGKSVAEYRRQVKLERQRYKRTQELAELKDYFSSGSMVLNEPSSSTCAEGATTFTFAELELLDSLYPAKNTPPKKSAALSNQYDLSDPVFVFKKLEYQPTVPVLKSPSPKRSSSSGSTSLARSRSDSAVSARFSSEAQREHSQNDEQNVLSSPNVIPNSVLVQVEQSLEVMQPELVNTGQQEEQVRNVKQHSNLTMRRNLNARVPAFLRSHTGYGSLF